MPLKFGFEAESWALEAGASGRAAVTTAIASDARGRFIDLSLHPELHSGDQSLGRVYTQPSFLRHSEWSVVDVDRSRQSGLRLREACDL